MTTSYGPILCGTLLLEDEPTRSCLVIVSIVQSKPFLDDARSAVHGLRRALADVLTSVQANADEPQELSRRFGLDKTLTWRIARVIRAEDPSEAVPHLPRPPSIRIFVRAMSKHGAPADRVESVLTALNQFERFVEVHSGDRETLEMMLGASPKRTAAKRMEAFRKSGFQANSAIWGVQARTQISLHIMAPGPDESGLCMSTVCGLTDFRRLRPDVPWSVAAMARWDEDGADDVRRRVEPLDPGVAAGDPPLIREFCSQPMPELYCATESHSLVRYMLAEGPVGNTAAATVVFGWCYPNSASRFQSYPGEEGEHGVMLSTPVESVIHDLLIHRSLDFAFNPTAHVYSQLPGGPQYPASGRKAGLLPVPDELVDLGSNPDMTTVEIPRYREISEFAVAHLGHTLADYRGYRFRIKYPPIPAIAILRHNLLPAPAQR